MCRLSLLYSDEALDIISDQAINLLITDNQKPGKHSGVDVAQVVADPLPKAGITIPPGKLAPAEIDLPALAQFFPKPYDLSVVVDRRNAFEIRKEERDGPSLRW